MIPETMRAITITEPGGPDVLQLTHLPVPQPTNREVLIRVHAAGINRPDIAQRQGIYPPPIGASPLPGLEVAGEIIAVGSHAHLYPIGSRVLALLTGGGYAEFVTVDERAVLPIPESKISGTTMDFIHAAAIPETFFTVWSNLFHPGLIKKGTKILIHGGSSGIGTTAIQLAKLFEATIFVTAGSNEKCQACLKLGADFAINYREKDFVEEIHNFTENQGVDVILDMVGGTYVERNYRAAATGGHIIQIATLEDMKATITPALLMVKRLTHTGSTLRPREIDFKEVIASELYQTVWPYFANGTISPIIQTIFPLEQAADAHRLLEKSEHIGKIVLKLIE